jgi:acetyl-CoA synthetase
VHGVLVQKMAPPGLEVMVGARIDRLFGPLIVVGLGGVLVELLADTAVAPAPVTREQAVAMLRGLKGARLLAGYRGGPAVDVDALAEVVARLSELVADQAGLIEEMDVNPLICAGDGIVAVDALLVRRGGEDALAETPEVPGGGVG